MRQSRGNRCLHLLSAAKERTRVRNNLRRKRPDVHVYSHGGKEVKGGLKTKQKEPMGVYTVHTCTSIVLIF